MSIIASLILNWINSISPPPASKQQRSAEFIISRENYMKRKRPDVELLSQEVKAQLTYNMRHKMLKAFMIKRIREYLEDNVKAYPTHFRYKNDIHKIMTMLSSGAITIDQLLYVKSMLR